jgi:hypothetical protein
MGRKLNAFEEAGHFSSEVGTSRQDRTGLSRNESLQHRIAQQLGISVAELRDPNVVHGASSPARSTDLALIRECVELLDAYIHILDPEQRLRCLQAVREAASRSVGADPAS